MKEELEIPAVVRVARIEDLQKANQKPTSDSKIRRCYHCKKDIFIDGLAIYYADRGSVILCIQCEEEVGLDFEEMPNVLVPLPNVDYTKKFN